MTWALLGGLGAALLAAIVLGWRVVAQGRDFAARLAAAYNSSDKAIGFAKAETKEALQAQRYAEQEKSAHKTAAVAAVHELGKAREEIARLQRLTAKREEQLKALQEIIDAADTPIAVRSRLRALLGVSRVTG